MQDDVKGEVQCGHEGGVVPGIERKPALELPVVPVARDLSKPFCPLDEDEQSGRYRPQLTPGHDPRYDET